ncbi:MAG: glycosyltransferase family 2 protein [Bacteroidota bacterium]
MPDNKKYLENVSLLITHYNRSKSLERLLAAFDDLGISFYDVIVSDDGSKAEHIEYIKSLASQYKFTLVTAAKNGGLGNNINKGQDAVKTTYTLYIQEDFIPLKDFLPHFLDGLSIMEHDEQTDIVRFYAYEKYPNLKGFKNGFSELVYNPWSLNVGKSTIYSDHPHLKRNTFFGKFGRYTEMKNPEETEYDMMMSFIKNKGKAYIYKEYKTLLAQANTTDEPSTMTRNYWRNSKFFLISFARFVFRHFKFSYRYLLHKNN